MCYKNVKSNVEKLNIKLIKYGVSLNLDIERSKKKI
jgi:hypothetical protein